MSCCCHCQLESGLCCQHHGFSSIATNLAFGVVDQQLYVNRVMWSPDGALFAHLSKVNDLSFSHQNRKLFNITCGEDKAVKVWNAVAGNKLYTFDRHKAPVYSVCPHNKENLHDDPGIRFNKEGIMLVVSTSENGIKILANANGVRLLHSIENQAVDTSRVAPTAIAKELKFFIDVYAYVLLTCLNLEEKMPSVEVLA
ncbi:hypothetical protein SO802_005853 [Lithocarpus litseifolius]|uniref:Uncharacterized protein n=1 Tax=Lithocarpus litseifolius TaxID=425828 RepID=A0AAW2DN68_9ROSI